MKWAAWAPKVTFPTWTKNWPRMRTVVPPGSGPAAGDNAVILGLAPEVGPAELPGPGAPARPRGVVVDVVEVVVRGLETVVPGPVVVGPVVVEVVDLDPEEAPDGDEVPDPGGLVVVGEPGTVTSGPGAVVDVVVAVAVVVGGTVVAVVVSVVVVEPLWPGPGSTVTVPST